jgi:hypothetical protein
MFKEEEQRKKTKRKINCYTKNIQHSKIRELKLNRHAEKLMPASRRSMKLSKNYQKSKKQIENK